ncbi:small ribosomal subunit protein mS27 [Euwallacea fornicatus]|uniref:small ribosomal subunit protein mS27 n=1 Tax=Euwallacea fornicatus TaxID=995702 RepID=UPI00338E0B4B
MLQIIRLLPKRHFLKTIGVNTYNLRTFLSEAYYCQEIWNQRLNSSLLQKINLEEFYYELDQKYAKTQQLNSIDIDVFANAMQGDQFGDELLDIVHKLRLTADTGNTSESTSHAVIRTLLQLGKIEDLLNVLDDRLNYGIFLDYYTANLLMDTFWKSKQYAHGSRIASQLMLQEELEHPLVNNFSLLHCYNYLKNPLGWPEYTLPPEPEEEVKIRVKYLRNPYDDEHFDLRNDKKIIGKTIFMISRSKQDPLNLSFQILGLALFGKDKEALDISKKVNVVLVKEILDLIPEDSKVKDAISELKTESDTDVGKILIENVKHSVEKYSESDISRQCENFEKWQQERTRLLQEQQHRLTTAKRLETIDDLKKALKDKEERLWFFENEEKIDLEIEAKQKFYPRRWFGYRKPRRQVDTNYVPPEVLKKHSSGNIG